MAKALKGWAAIAGGLTAAAPLALAAPAFAADPVKVEVSGKASAAAGLADGDARADADAEITFRGSTVFANGVELGAVVEGRFDKQQPNQLFAGGRYSGPLIGGPRGIAPLTSDAYLQGAYGYVRGSFGQLIVGRDHGVARTFAVTAPTIFQSVNVNDWRTDLSGLNDVHTVNDFSGYSTKFSYLPPANFLGGVLGGLQLGVSYSPVAAHCGEDLCAPEDRLFITPAGALLTETSRWEDVVEAAAYYQKELKLGGAAGRGLLFGVGASYVSASEDARVSSPDFDDYRAYSLGLNLGFRGLTLGGSVKSTNSGLANIDDQGYLAFDAGITFKTGEDKGDWGVMLGYGQSEANVAAPPSPAQPLIFRDTRTTQAGVTYFVGRGITVGAAAQFVESKKPASVGGLEEAATVVIESSIKF